MRPGGCLIGGALTAAAGVIWKVIKFLGETVGKAIYYFGLYVPLLYLIYGLVLYLVFKFPLFVFTTDGKLYLFGLALSAAAAVILTWKHLVVRPYEKYFKKTDVVEYKSDGKLAKDAPEAPRIYKSRVNPGVTVYEYADRYDLYEEYADGLQLVNREFKTKKARRW